MSKLVSIITVNYKNNAVTLDLLHSIIGLNRNDLEVIVVELGSQNCDPSIYQAIISDIVVIHNKENLGFSAGNNLGITKASGEFLYLVNNDTILLRNSIDPLIKILNDDPTIGIVSPKIKYYDEPNTIQYAGYTLVDTLTGRNKTIGEYAKDNPEYNHSYEVGFIHGAAMMTKKEYISKVGLMPLDYFLYYEELAWSDCFHKQGLKTYYEGNAEILHKESMSVGKNSPLKEYFIFRNRLLFMKHYTSSTQFPIFFIFISIFSLPKRYFSLLFQSNTKNLRKALLTGYTDAISYLINTKNHIPDKGLKFL
ncbi:glycosyltransferase family 2 protein [Flammeovirga sp. SubArs3]|uniref:glycosyltransferase family 2 protein n=1 Tax=Flammeovirga sp. SubArs3 TaxID=2995316 RepID=UPI00248ABE69|nr:glycosyltransferase family 2 protein [Flammeovirga sp. SubArs3]